MSLPQIVVGQDLLKDALLVSVEVVQELNQHWWCLVVCRQTLDQRIPVEDMLGKEVEIKTIDDYGVSHPHFSGFICDVQLTYEIWGSYTARLVAVSSSYKLDITAHKQYYAEKNLEGTARIIADRSGGLTIKVKVPSSKPLNYVQYGETDFSFLSRIVDDYGAWFRPFKEEGEDGEKAQEGVEIFNSFQGGSTVTWRKEGDLIAFSLHGKLAPASFSGAHYDHHSMVSKSFTKVSKLPEFYDGGKGLSDAVQSASKKLPPGFETQRSRAMKLEDYETQLNDESERSLGAAITGEGQSRNQNLKAGDKVKIDGTLDARGTYGMVKVTHRWTKNGYSNSFVCTPWQKYRNPRAPVARTWNGVVPARVVDHNDPQKMGRIKIQFFWQEDGCTHWARTVSPHAGPDRGFVFMPEKGDEVAVIFEDGDPERPLVMGSVWNGVHNAPRSDYYSGDKADETNKCKRLVTMSGNRLQFVDTKGQEAVVLATPNNNSLTMTEESGATKRNLVVVHTKGDIILSAPEGRIHLKAAFFSHEIGSSKEPNPG